jgi:hypothetical protein
MKFERTVTGPSERSSRHGTGRQNPWRELPHYRKKMHDNGKNIAKKKHGEGRRPSQD